jgi:DNA mismatch repair protein MutL
LAPYNRRVPIQELPKEVASAIAAGEVVERPESVVRELIENAIDAAAESISVRIQAGGKSLIEVADDGQGIPPDQVKLAVARYSTSKLQTAEDLRAIRSLGFRGEALASIGAVSRMRLVTKTEGTPAGTVIEIEGGKIAEPAAIGSSQGTLVTVRDLFYNVPARRRFLKAEVTERNRVSRLITRYAMGYPSIRFQVESDGRESLLAPGNGNRVEALAAVLGHDRAEQMIPVVEPDRAGARLQGFISPPFLNRANRRDITLFVNGRWIQDIGLSSAVVQAYHGLLMVGKYPIAVIFVEIPPDQIDVNVHPAKAEVRFVDPGFVFSMVQRAVRATLLGMTPVQSMAFESQLSPTLLPPALEHERTVAPASPVEMDVPVMRAVGQVGATYLIAEGPDGVYLIDQHAAHERVLFERLMAQAAGEEPASQTLLEAVTLEFGPQDMPTFSSTLDTLRALGFGIEPFGSLAVKIRAIPAAITEMSPERVLRTVVEEFEEDETALAEDQEARIAARVCKRAAIKAGQVLSLAEQRQLITDLERCELPRTCPHGRPTMIHLSVAALERQFGRR